MKLNAVVDRIEGASAVLLVCDETKQVIFPCECLPSEVKEGDHLIVAVAVDTERTQAAQAEAEDLLAQILKNNTK